MIQNQKEDDQDESKEEIVLHQNDLTAEQTIEMEFKSPTKEENEEMEFKSPIKLETEEMDFNQKANELKKEFLDE